MVKLVLFVCVLGAALIASSISALRGGECVGGTCPSGSGCTVPQMPQTAAGERATASAEVTAPGPGQGRLGARADRRAERRAKRHEAGGWCESRRR